MVYYIDDKRVQTVNELPFEFAYDFSIITTPSVKITAKAYLSDGTLASSKDYQLKLVSPAIKVLYDGEVLRFDQLPTVIEGRTLVPMKTIFVTFGMTVSYDAPTKTITAKNAAHEIKLTIGNPIATVDGKPVQLDVPPRIISGRTMVPLKFISQSLGLGVEYDAKTRVITIE